MTAPVCAECGCSPSTVSSAAQPAGADVGEVVVPWTWSTSTDEDGRRSYLCWDCARRHARSIEAKLKDEWW